MAEILDVTDDNFEAEVLQSDLPVFVDFWSETCPPCKAIAPMIKQLADEYDGRVKVVKVNTMDNPMSPNRYAVRSIPTILTIKGGQVVGQIVGARSKDAYVELIENMLG